ncbi:MAG: diguanylate cyclase, partial [Pseudomonadota bacterium]
LVSAEARAPAPRLLMLPAEATAARLAALRAGADGIVASDVGDEELLARIEALLRGRKMIEELRLRERTAASLGLPAPEDPPRREGGLILLMPEGEAARRRAAHLATALRLRVRLAADGRAAMDAAAQDAPELMLAAPPPEQTAAALRLISALRAQRTLRGAGLVALLPGPDAVARALDLGADDAVDSRAGEAELALRLEVQRRRARWADRLQRLEKDGFALAATDGLTGLWNRRYALSHLGRLVADAREAAEPLALLMIDLDRFKAINDAYGHAAGDAVLREFAARLREALRGADLAARLGGEEFCAALRGADRETALQVAERLREATAGRPFGIPGLPEGIAVTVSIGVACTPSEPDAALTEPGAVAPPARTAVSPPARTAVSPPARTAVSRPAPAAVARRSPASVAARPPGAAAPQAASAFSPPASAEPLGLAEPEGPAPTPPGGRAGVSGLVDPSLVRSVSAAEAEALLASADAALYASKQGGRNRVTADRAA